jgi:hypothetical protein
MGATYSAHRQALAGAEEGVSPQQLRTEIERLEAIDIVAIRLYLRVAKAATLPAFIAARRIVATWLREVLQTQRRLFDFASDDQIKRFIAEQRALTAPDASPLLPVAARGSRLMDVPVKSPAGERKEQKLFPNQRVMVLIPVVLGGLPTNWVVPTATPSRLMRSADAPAQVDINPARANALSQAANAIVTATMLHPYYRQRLTIDYGSWQMIRDLNIQAAEWVLSARFGRQMAAGQGPQGPIVITRRPPTLPTPAEQALQFSLSRAQRQLGTEAVPPGVTSLITRMAAEGVGPEELAESKGGWLEQAWAKEEPFIKGPRPPPPPPGAGAAGLGLGAMLRRRHRSRSHRHALCAPRR